MSDQTWLLLVLQTWNVDNPKEKQVEIFGNQWFRISESWG